ncbi:flagellar basal body P-ring formation chaperone FlgA [Erwinia sorbitola]|uniref:Flagella basal body P-ring formation protein FlgA n=1 Tax=Erwinia sorbitola TaxID=2681984 RepID=A0A6I6EW10_9GAMM|nr:flagellar basal body P-ring formation chaperone FlgA [Erwinia sorbitola]QGU88523.1 flagellar basal body P-ring formation protein FlgA [Erwinia sorbitola]
MCNPIANRKSRFLLLALWGLAFVSAAAPEAKTARKQIYQQAVASAAADIKRTAMLKKWEGYHSKINVFIPTEASRFTRCARPLTVAMPVSNRPDLSRLRYDIRCEGAEGWEVNVTVKPDIYLPILVARSTLARGKLLAASDVTIKKKNITGLRDGIIVNPDDAIGLTVKKRIRDMQPISPSMLDQPLMVERGQQVVMLAMQDGVQARMIGVAMKKGRKGDIIKVKNLTSERTVSAVVEGQGLVHMQLAAGQ